MGEPSIARGMRPNRHPLDEDSATRLLQGLVHPDDAPPGYAAVAGLLSSAAQTPLGPVDEDAAAITVSTMVEVIRNATPAPEMSRRKTMLGRLLAGKAIAAVAVIGLTATGAAATGSLPDQAQAVVSDAVGHVGVKIPHPNHGKSAAHRQDGKNKPSGDDQGQPGDDTKGMSGTVENLKQQIEDGTLEGDSDSPNSGPSTENKGNNSDDPSGKSGEDHGKLEDTPATPEKPAKPEKPNGSIDTGSENSGRDLPAGKGKPK